MNTRSRTHVRLSFGRWPASALLVAAIGICVGAGAVTLRTDDFLPNKGLGKLSKQTVSQAVALAAARLKAGDALIMPTQPFGTVTMPSLPEDVQLLGGTGDQVVLSGLAKGLVVFGADYAIDAASNNAKLAGGTFFIETQQDRSFADAESTYIIANIGAIKAAGKWKDVTGVWIRYNHEHQRTSTPSMWFDLQGTGDNCKILCAIEHNQGGERQALLVENANGMAFAHGSTESMSSYNGAPLYELVNCTGVYLGQRRFFSGRGPRPSTSTSYNDAFFDRCRAETSCWSQAWPQTSTWIQACRGDRNCWKGWPSRSLRVTGGNGNILDNIVDLGNPLKYSYELYDDATIQLWSLFGEAELLLPETRQAVAAYSVTPGGQKSASYATGNFIEPREIDDEIVLSLYTASKTYDLTNSTDLAAMSTGPGFPAPPKYPKCDIPKPPTLLYKQAASFGAALLAAGADPTGRGTSDDAFERVARERGILEIPAGTFRLDRGLTLPSLAGKRFMIVGAGEGSTRLVGRGACEYLRTATDARLARAAVNESVSGAGTVMVTGMTFDGQGTQDWAKTSIGINDVFVNCTFTNYVKGACLSNTSQPEQYRFIGCKFINTGEYGVRLDTYSDKPLFYRCYFEGQTKGGLYCTRIVHFHGGVYQCDFKNIGGPAVKIGGGNMTVGYGSWVFAIDNCTFDECGNSTEAVVDMGYSWDAAFAHSTIKSTKAIYAAFKGNFAIIDDVDIDVNADTAMYLGHQRYERTAGIGGGRLRDVTVHGTGKIAFLSQYDAMKDDPGYPTSRDGKADVFYSRQPDLYGQYPWAFTHMFYNVKSANINESYAVYNKGMKAIDLSSYTVGVPGTAPRDIVRPTRTPPAKYYSPSGRLVAVGEIPRNAALSRAVLIARPSRVAGPAKLVRLAR